MREFDAHIYFTSKSEKSAHELRKEMLREFASDPVRIGDLNHQPVGPHPFPMFEANFKKEVLSKMVNWLELHRNGHIVLVHPVTGDDWIDHTTSAKWLGEPVPLDFSKF